MGVQKKKGPTKMGATRAALRARIAHLERLVGASPMEDGSEEESAQHPALEGTAVEDRAQVQEAIDALSEGFLFFDAEERMVLCNRTYREYFAPVSEQLVPGMTMEEWAQIVASSGQVAVATGREEAWIAQRLEDFRNPGKIEEFDFGGRIIQIREYKTASGGTAGLRLDITKAREAERALADQADTVALLQDIAIAANEAESPGQAIQTCLDRVCAYTSWPIGHALLLARDGSGELESAKLWHLDDPAAFDTFHAVSEESRFAAGVGLPGRVLESAEPAWIPDVTKDAKFHRAKLVENIGVKAGFAFPILVGSNVAAVLEFFSEHEAEPDRSLLEVMRHIGAQLGRVIERDRAAGALRESEERCRSILDNITDGFYRTDANNRIVMASPSAATMLGYTPEDLLGTNLADLYVDRDGREKFLAALHNSGGKITGFESVLKHCEGREIWVSSSAGFARDGDGNVVGVEGTVRDITERKEAEEALRDSERRTAEARELLMDAIESSPDGIGIYDSDDRLVVFNQKFRGDMLSGIADLIEPGVSYETLLRAAVDRELVVIPDGDVEKYVAERQAHHRGGEGSREIALKNDRWMLARERRMRRGGIVGTRADITDMKRAEKALRESEERFRAVVDNSPSSVTLKGLDGRYRLVNKRFEEWFGPPAGRIEGKRLSDITPGDAAEDLMALDAEAIEQRKTLEVEVNMPIADGGVRSFVVTKFPVFDGQDRIIGVGNIGVDVTEQRRTEEQLLQAQKMEAVGQLTGGVAHDFNNLLAVIQGNLELMEDMLEDDSELLELVARATMASRRATDLTQRLLAFSRKQALEPQIVDLSALVAGLGELFRRTLGEDIEIVTAGAGGLWPCEVDPSQLENALLNLAINARDAMPEGGKLTIETANARLDDDYAAAQAEVEPGQYVLLAVSDTGTGMAREVADRAFDPFFTTKEVGKGSGLGLSMIYGFVKQSGGHVRIYSEEGEGTTVKIYLPRAAREIAPEPTAEVKPEAPEGRGEAVLVVEDDPDVRTLAIVLLQKLGYTTLDAGSGPDALAILERTSGVDLLLTDVVLPGGMNGRDLANEIQRRRPGLPVLYMSGYTQDAVVHHGRLDEGVELLHKPFRKHELAVMVRRALGIGNS